MNEAEVVSLFCELSLSFNYIIFVYYLRFYHVDKNKTLAYSSPFATGIKEHSQSVKDEIIKNLKINF